MANDIQGALDTQTTHDVMALFEIIRLRGLILELNRTVLRVIGSITFQ